MWVKTFKEKMMESAIKEKIERTPEEKIWVGVIQQCMEDAFGLSTSTNITPGEIRQAQDWFNTTRCAEVCDLAGTTQDHVISLYKNLKDNYNSGKISTTKLRFGIKRLEQLL